MKIASKGGINIMANYAVHIINRAVQPATIINDTGHITNVLIASPNRNYLNVAAEWKVRIRASEQDNEELIRVK